MDAGQMAASHAQARRGGTDISALCRWRTYAQRSVALALALWRDALRHHLRGHGLDAGQQFRLLRRPALVRHRSTGEEMRTRIGWCVLSLAAVLPRLSLAVDPDRKSTRLNSSHVSESRMP